MQLAELPRLKAALDLMGLDNGANVCESVVIPPEWEMRARIAEDELLHMHPDKVMDLVFGEESDQRTVATGAPNADQILNAAFDGGELSEVIFEPWASIFDARDAEEKAARKSHPRS